MTETRSDIREAVQSAIEKAIPEAKVSVEEAGGGHFRVAVVSSVFEGKTTLQRHRLVLSAIAPLMAGANAPVHAIDAIDARTA